MFSRSEEEIRTRCISIHVLRFRLVSPQLRISVTAPVEASSATCGPRTPRSVPSPMVCAFTRRVDADQSAAWFAERVLCAPLVPGLWCFLIELLLKLLKASEDHERGSASRAEVILWRDSGARGRDRSDQLADRALRRGPAQLSSIEWCCAIPIERDLHNPGPNLERWLIQRATSEACASDCGYKCRRRSFLRRSARNTTFVAAVRRAKAGRIRGATWKYWKSSLINLQQKPLDLRGSLRYSKTKTNVHA